MTATDPAATLRAAAARLRADEFTAMPWGAPLADWLELEASMLTAIDTPEADLGSVPARLVLQSCRHALAVARAVLGEGVAR